MSVRYFIGIVDCVISSMAKRIGEALMEIPQASSPDVEVELIAANQQLLEARERLSESEERFRCLVENAPIGISIIIDGIRRYVNAAYSGMFGYGDDAEVVDGVALDQFAPEVRDEIAARMQARERGDAVPNAYETVGLRKDGSRFPVSLAVARVQMPSGLATISFLRDVTERRQVEELKRRAFQELEDRVRERTAELALINAELRQEIAQRAGLEAQLETSLEVLRKTLESTVRAMSSVVELRDPYTAGHQRRVAELAHEIAQRMGWGDGPSEIVRIAGTVHDIGKISVPAEILAKPGKVSFAEFELIKKHVEAGYEILSAIEFPWPLAEIVAQHHERLDGSGHPKGLTANDILPEAKVLAVSDVVEAMASHRPHRPAFSVDDSLCELSRSGNLLYDEQVVDACQTLFVSGAFTFDPRT